MNPKSFFTKWRRRRRLKRLDRVVVVSDCTSEEEGWQPLGVLVPRVLEDVIAAVKQARDRGIECGLPREVIFSEVAFDANDELRIEFSVPLHARPN